MSIETGAPDEDPVPASVEALTAPAAPRYERTTVLFGAFFLIALAVLVVAMLTVHQRQPLELAKGPGSKRSHIVLSNWLREGYFHYAGMINRNDKAMSIYRSSTGGYMVSGFIVEKLNSTAFGDYNYELLGLHNQVVSAILSALAGLLSYRLARRFELEPRLALTAGAAVVIVIFTFPDNLDLYWEMTPQAYGLLFALLYLVIEERLVDRTPRPRALLLVQAATVFAMAFMEGMVAFGLVASVAATTAILRRERSWTRFLLVVVLPTLTAFLLYQAQLKTVTARFPNVPMTGSKKLLWRTGLDGSSVYYGDHLGIATRRDGARANWAANREYLFRWKWTFILGLASTLVVLLAFLAGRAPRIALEVLAALIGTWLLYAAMFSQALVIHPYLYDVLLFTPLCIALFALAPSLLESMTKRTGAIVLVIAFSAVWYSFFQLRLYSLRWPLLPPPVERPASPSPQTGS